MKLTSELKNKLSKVLSKEELNSSVDSIRQILELKLDEARENVPKITIHTPDEDFIISKEEIGIFKLRLDAYSSFMEWYNEELDFVN